MFERGQPFGIDILPRHFYSEVPDMRALGRSRHWKAPYAMTGVDGVDIGTQVDFVHQVCGPAVTSCLVARAVHREACAMNGAEGFGPIEADFLYAFVSERRPKQIFQIGCGVSTAVCLLAAADSGYRPDIICVEPYPTAFLREAHKAGRIRLVEQVIEALPHTAIDELGGDLLFFVDSTHCLGPAGEVSRIVLEMLPRLKAGAVAHFHDIQFPYDYDRHVLESTLFFQHESVLLHAFLAYNTRFRLLASLSMLHYRAPDVLAACLPNYRPAANDEGLNAGEGHFPSSAYIAVLA